MVRLKNLVFLFALAGIVNSSFAMDPAQNPDQKIVDASQEKRSAKKLVKRKHADDGSLVKNKKTRRNNQAHCDQELLSYVAEVKGLGYKTANSMQLRDNVCDALNKAKKTIYIFAVPYLVGISSKQVQEFLCSHGLNLVDRWQEIIERYFPSQEILDHVLEQQRFPDGFLESAKKLERDIAQTFDVIINELPDHAKLELIFKLDDEQTRDLNLVLKSKSKLMVRSTGKEDTEKLANAGGNESVANVSPKTKPILRGIKKVVASYFSEKSLTQRLCAKDRSIIEAPFTPVLIQCMVDAPLPRCGVMFTEEAEGALSKKQIKYENGTIKTSGITIVQAAYGHNEGVVNSIIPVDTYCVTTSGRIYQRIKEKCFRVVPVAQGKLEKKKNDPACASRSALEPEAIKALKLLAQKLENFYQKPMDVEFVILDKTIYLVQARPIVHDSDQPAPSYVDLNHELLQNVEKISGTVVGVAGGAVQCIEDKNQCIVKKNIRDALAEYQNCTNKKNIKAILIGEMAPATSHEATMFRGASKPVIAFEKNFSDIESWIAQGNVKFVLDTQQQTLIRWNGKNFDDTNCVHQGWINYPLPLHLTTLPYAHKKDIAFNALQETLFSGISAQERSQAQRALRDEFKQNGATEILKKLIMQLKTADQQTAYGALQKIWLFCTTLPVSQGYAQRICSLLNIIAQTMLELIPALNVTQDNDDYLAERLFPIYALETFLFQHEKDSFELPADSIIKLMTLMREEKIGSQNVVSSDERAKISGILGNHALTPNLKRSWDTFLNDVISTIDDEQKEKFYRVLIRLAELDLLPLWLHTTFAESADKNVQSFIYEFEQAQEFLNKMLEYKGQIDAVDPNAFDNPKAFLKLWTDFKENILEYFCSDFIGEFNQATRLGKLAALRVMEKVVATFDTSIKAITGSINFVVTMLPNGKTLDEVLAHDALAKEQIDSKKDKLFTFRLMLVEYRKLLVNWRYKGNAIPADELRVNELLNKLKNTTNQEQLEARNFNVNAVSLGNNAVQERMSELDTLEKYFTFCHQSLLNQIAFEMKQYGFNVNQCPQFIVELDAKIRRLSAFFQGDIVYTHLIGASFSNDELTLLYNYPQRAHSAQIEVKYSAKSGICLMELRMFGENVEHGYRWNKCVDILEYRSVGFNIPYSSIQSNEIFQFQWVIGSDAQKNESLIDDLISCCELVSKTALGEPIQLILENTDIFETLLKRKRLCFGIFEFWQKCDNNDQQRLTKAFLDHCVAIPVSNFAINDVALFFEKIIDQNNDSLIKERAFEIAGKLVNSESSENSDILRHQGYKIIALLYKNGYEFSFEMLQNFIRLCPWDDFKTASCIFPVIKALKDRGDQNVIDVLRNEVKSVQYEIFNESIDDLLDFFHNAITLFCRENKNDFSILFSKEHPCLKKIDCSSSLIKEIIGLEMCSNLEELNLSRVMQSEIPRLSGRCNNLKAINLSYAKIESLEIRGDDYPSLQQLNLFSTTELKTFVLIGKFQNLNEVDLCGTGITGLFELSGDNFPNLKTLNLNYAMQITDFKLLGRFESLKKIDISLLRIRLLKLLGNNFPNLESLNISYSIKEAGFNLLGRFENLKKIYLSGTKIEQSCLSRENFPLLEFTII